MNAFHRLAERVRRGEDVPWPLGPALSAATPVVRLGMWNRLRATPVRVDTHVVSFGNITAGGTGKTPCLMERAAAEVAQGKRVGVLTRGYHSASREAAVSEAIPPTEYFERLGDEAALILGRVPEVVVFKNADRVAAARLAVAEYACDILLLDDGFQYVELARDENIAVIDASCPFGNGYLIPRGTLREPTEALARATSVTLTRCDQARDLAKLEAKIRQLCGPVPIRRTVHRPTGLRRLSDGESFPLEWLRGQPIAAACAIGNPDAFFRTLEELGADLVERRALRDHAVVDDFGNHGNPVVVTEKDAVRRSGFPGHVYALVVEIADFTEAGGP